MSLPIGSRLGRYEILGVLGAGGMGEVYRAHDASLKRDVAIKVILDRAAADSDGLRRFEREALATAALNHPNILAVYDVGAHEGTAFVVSELLEGRTLHGVLAAGAPPLRKTVDYAAQIASGLAAAHEKGIVHRDLKPANLWVTKDGRVKILDFGLARILRDVTQDEGASLSRSPTMTRPDAVLGTAGYMAPEQVRGEPADHRADIFSFGVVLYEMLTGYRAFKRDTTPGTLAAILDADPPSWPGDGSSLSLRLLSLAHRCLEKAPQARFQSARDLSFFLADEGSDPKGDPVVRRAGRFGPAGLAVAVALLIALGAWGWSHFGSPRNEPTAASGVVFEIFPPEGDRWPAPFHPAISDDGKRIAYAAAHDGASQLFVRTLTDRTARALPGTAGAIQPFFSPDGRSVAFFADDQLKSTSIDQGLPHVICPVSAPRGGSWGDDDFIVFANGPNEGLSRVAANGGTPEVFTFLDAGNDEGGHRFPRVMPGANGVLFTIQKKSEAMTRPSVAVQPAGSRQHTTIVERGEGPQYAQHRLIYVNDHQEPMSAPFDPVALRLTGPAVAQLERTTAGNRSGDSGLGVALNGTLVYKPYETNVRSLAIVSRQGAVTPVPAPERAYYSPRVSPDGKRIAVTIQSGVAESDVWVGEESGHFTRLTTVRRSSGPVWTPDSQRLAFLSVQTGHMDIFSQPVDGSGPAAQLTPPTIEGTPSSWLPDGRSLIVTQFDGQTGISDIRVLTAGRSALPQLLFPTKVDAYGTSSPDGRWLAYTSRVSGQWEVYVTTLPTPGRTIPVSQGGGGGEIVWAKTGEELFFRRLGGQVVSVKVGAGGPSGEAPRPVGIGDFPRGSPGQPEYDTFPDGRFLVVKGESDRQAKRPLVVVLDWIAERAKK